ncbi:dethiobiotin synthase [Buchnera aphidicola str. APS (Acyrthosiphon pisum)]|uniref:ATP-dependent dethiobiotin synthetase BioD n=1 Tax=Buchnera aphidicola subsp. Acyrthosiphon pisum (strain APS) TaxID=107806 RepID=BIOD_BUCAI|nr:dethiobiotin synthase [Buchnera aphidicola]P57377.1 RecName: Full=ATP-dependent dethiobiotin synthetase BioD; AltName: Full=DTB synthetase; Short=DTBS; AltName: Full=Dethiobiotin synthase [Buchnera aphidicola str. APS (Acyrthosiphon pisum)]pir/H84963/ dethiobiotin synthase (EC 6.3.3.3) [imported] - Buchnera sp. (strain APS) [Buchnera sp. (in: enterobacteria)]BAB13000.1 dethiobiotin synthetase [Buchnera aphidicola str. APS (Acyrthosiphon pisum)]
MIKKFFITGTDTNVGKTIVSSILLKKATMSGYQTAGYKPVSSGGQKKSSGFFNQDAILLKKSSSIILSDREVNPIAFFENAPPHILSKFQKRSIKKEELSLGLNNITKKSNWILVEGAGGWYTPLSCKDTFSSWVKQEKLTVIIIIAIKLGCINHAILTEKAIISDQIKCGGWIANNIFPKDKYNMHYIQTLLNYIKSPFLGVVPYFKNKNRINFKKIKIKLPK